jgi:hypothetical protein
LAYFSSRV